MKTCRSKSPKSWERGTKCTDSATYEVTDPEFEPKTLTLTLKLTLTLTLFFKINPNQPEPFLKENKNDTGI